MVWRILLIGLLVLLGLFAYQALEGQVQFNLDDLALVAAGVYVGVAAIRKMRQEGFTRSVEVLLYLTAIGLVFGLAYLFNFQDQPIWIASMALLVIGFGLRLWRM